MTTNLRFLRLHRARYRIGQGLGYVFARSTPDAEMALPGLLTPLQRELVAGLSVRDQTHHLQVYQRLRGRNCDDPDLLLAALLHDCGKSDRQGRAGVSQRTLLVLAGTRYREQLRKVGLETGAGWRHGLYLAIEHPRLGAARARAAGCSERVCWLIEHHHDPTTGGDAGLSLFQTADDEGELGSL